MVVTADRKKKVLQMDHKVRRFFCSLDQTPAMQILSFFCGLHMIVQISAPRLKERNRNHAVTSRKLRIITHIGKFSIFYTNSDLATLWKD